MIEFAIETNTLYDLLKRVKPFATAKDYRRPILQGICCNVTGNYMKCVALNGYIFIETIVPIDNKSGEDGRFVLPPVKVEKSKDAGYTLITVGDKDITLTDTSGSRTVRKYNGEYVDYTRLYPQKPAESVIYMDATMLAKVLSTFPKGDRVEIQYRGELSPLIISNSGASTLVFPIRPPRNNKEKEHYYGLAEV